MSSKRANTNGFHSEDAEQSKRVKVGQEKQKKQLILNAFVEMCKRDYWLGTRLLVAREWLTDVQAVGTSRLVSGDIPMISRIASTTSTIGPTLHKDSRRPNFMGFLSLMFSVRIPEQSDPCFQVLTELKVAMMCTKVRRI